MGHVLQMTGFKLEIFLKLIKEFVTRGFKTRPVSIVER